MKLHYKRIIVDCICRSPCGERGLKYYLPPYLFTSVTSLPVRGAWVEIFYKKAACKICNRRSPCGERGLK